jgi:hypothetical protein
MVFAKVSVFAKDFAKKYSFCENFHQSFGSGYTFRWCLNPDPQSEWKIFAKPKIFTQIFDTFCKLFSRKVKGKKEYLPMLLCSMFTSKISF